MAKKIKQRRPYNFRLKKRKRRVWRESFGYGMLAGACLYALVTIVLIIICK